MPIRGGGPDFYDHINAPHYKGPQSCQDVQGDRRHMHLVNIDLALMASSRVLVIRWQNRTVLENAGLRFAFVFAKCRGKQESPPTFILSNWKGQKHRNIPFSRF